MTTMSIFWTYTTPSASATYSLQHLQGLMFSQILECSYPSFLPPNTLISWRFTNEVPTTARSTVILFDDIIPDIADLNQIMCNLEDAFNEEGRSVVLTFRDQDLADNSIIEQLYHFSKVCERVNVHYHHY